MCRYNSAMRRAKRLQRLHDAHHGNMTSIALQPASCSPSKPTADLAPEPHKKMKRNRDFHDDDCNSTTVLDACKVSDADAAPQPAGVLVETEASGSSDGVWEPAFSDAADKTESKEGKLVKKRRPSQPRKSSDQHGCVLDENFLWPGALSSLSPQHLSQLASMLGTCEHPGKHEELLELLMSQHLSPSSANSAVGSGVSPKILGEGSGQLIKADGSPFDFGAALQELSPQAFGAASPPPALAPSSSISARRTTNAAGRAKRGGSTRARGSTRSKGGVRIDAASADNEAAKADKAVPKRRRGVAKVTSALGSCTFSRITSEGGAADRPTPEDKRLLGDTLFSMLESLDPDEPGAGFSRASLCAELKQPSSPDSLELMPPPSATGGGGDGAVYPPGARPKDEDWLAKYNAPSNSSSSSDSDASAESDACATPAPLRSCNLSSSRHVTCNMTCACLAEWQE